MWGELPAGKWLGYRDDSERTEERDVAFSTVFESVSVFVFCFSYSLCVLPHWSSPSYHLGAFWSDDGGDGGGGKWGCRNLNDVCSLNRFSPMLFLSIGPKLTAHSSTSCSLQRTGVSRILRMKSVVNNHYQVLKLTADKQLNRGFFLVRRFGLSATEYQI